jgi:signal transduction histidine kinase
MDEGLTGSGKRTVLRERDASLARIAELEALLRARDNFIASIGHEMRNPLVPIVLTVERLRDLAAAGDLERLRRNIDILGKATDAFTRRTTQLLDLSRISSGNFVLVCEDMDFSRCVSETLDRHVDIARRAGCALQPRIEPGITGRGDRASLEQLLDNLLSNALKYGAARPVTVDFSQYGGIASLKVQDHGVGVRAEEQSRIFGLFERARNPGLPGLGIGLWIAAQIAAAMAGKIELHSEPGQGAIFTVTFPTEGPATAPGADAFGRTGTAP